MRQPLIYCSTYQVFYMSYQDGEVLVGVGQLHLDLTSHSVQLGAHLCRCVENREERDVGTHVN